MCATLASAVQSASAKCGNVDYSWGADALAMMHDYVVTMMVRISASTNSAGARRR